MWPQLGYRQGYSEGEDGEGVLSGTLASKMTAGHGERPRIRRKTVRLS